MWENDLAAIGKTLDMSQIVQIIASIHLVAQILSAPRALPEDFEITFIESYFDAHPISQNRMTSTLSGGKLRESRARPVTHHPTSRSRIDPGAVAVSGGLSQPRDALPARAAPQIWSAALARSLDGIDPTVKSSPELVDDTASPEQPEPLGFNTEVAHRHVVYHVQTEILDDDADAPVINTLVFQRGKLLHKLSTPYADLIGLADSDQQLRERIKRQHLTTLGRVKGGSFSSR